jgi:hypothetical protein
MIKKLTKTMASTIIEKGLPPGAARGLVAQKPVVFLSLNLARILSSVNFVADGF